MKYAVVGLLLIICVYGIYSLPHNEHSGLSRNSCHADADCVRLCSWLCRKPRLGKCIKNKCLCQARLPRSDVAPNSRQGPQEPARMKCPRSWED